MKFFLPILALIQIFLSFPAIAQSAPQALGEVLATPQCFRIINRAPYTIHGSFYTNYYVNAEGTKARHTLNFRLESGQSQSYCTSGPFYEGRKLDLVLRTLIPVFSCRTRVDSDIYLTGKILESGTQSQAICLE